MYAYNIHNGPLLRATGGRPEPCICGRPEMYKNIMWLNKNVDVSSSEKNSWHLCGWMMFHNIKTSPIP